MSNNKRNATGPRTEHAPDRYLMDWTAEHLPDCQSFYISDIDMLVRDRAGNFLIAEIKRRGAEMNHHQRATYELLDELIKAGIQANPKGIIIPSMRYPLKLKYKGIHLLQFENTTFEDGQIFWDKKQITPEHLEQILNFKTSPFI